MNATYNETKVRTVWIFRKIYHLKYVAKWDYFTFSWPFFVFAILSNAIDRIIPIHCLNADVDAIQILVITLFNVHYGIRYICMFCAMFGLCRRYEM